jgi:hypothetical protein
MLIIIIFLLLTVLCCQFFVGSLSKRCIYQAPLSETLYLTKINGDTEELGMTLIKYISSSPIQCGIYTATTQIDGVTVWVGKNSKYLCSVYFTENNKKTDADKKDIPSLLVINNLQRIESSDNYILDTYKKGCC